MTIYVNFVKRSITCCFIFSYASYASMTVMTLLRKSSHSEDRKSVV